MVGPVTDIPVQEVNGSTSDTLIRELDCLNIHLLKMLIQ